MGEFHDLVAAKFERPLFDDFVLREMFTTQAEQEALKQVTSALQTHTDDLVAMNQLVQQGGAVLGVVAKIARKALVVV
jgi:hypothetical protein